MTPTQPAKPILFSAPMVRAILDGSKTQTRRIVKIPAHAQIEERDDGKPWPWMYDGNRDADYWFPCPYGQPGGKLWVREAWRSTGDGGRCNDMPPRNMQAHQVWYEADGRATDDECVGKLRPSMFMPRWASRITLEITGVRIERLHDISEEDAAAEGSPCYVCGGPMNGRSEDDCHCFHATAKSSDYRALWEQINGPESWAANPWVWVVEFRRAKP